MNTPTKHTQEFINKRRMMLFIPLPGVICLTVLFYLGGGGKGVPAAAAGAGPATSGLNRTLPAVGKTSLYADKMEAYKAPQDSTRRNNLAFAPPPGEVAPAAGAAAGSASATGPRSASTPAGLNYAVQPGQSTQRYDPNADPNVMAMQSRMQRLQQQTSNQPAHAAPAPATSIPAHPAATPAQDEQLDESLKELDQLKNQYQKRLQALNAPAATPTTPAPALTGTKQPKEKGMSVITPVPRSVVSTLRSQGPATATTNGFHTVGEGGSGRAALNAVPAVVHDDQVVTQGSTVKLRLLSDVQLEGRLIPRNSFLYGTCSVSGKRLTINANQVQYQGSLLPVSLKAFDIDGGEGLNIPGSLDRDAAKQGLAQGTSSADLLTMSPSLGAQAAGIALQTGKALAGKKIRLVKIHLKANYQLLLKS